MPAETDTFARPQSLAEVASRADTLEEFGRHLQDFLHTLRSRSTRSRILEAIREKPPRLANRFSDGDAADAWLAACAETIALRLRSEPPAWAFEPTRVRATPWFSESDPHPAIRRAALVSTPPPFKRRNLYAAHVDIPVRIRAGRPALSAEHKRKTNAARQRRFRARRTAEIARLLHLFASMAGAPRS